MGPRLSRPCSASPPPAVVPPPPLPPPQAERVMAKTPAVATGSRNLGVFILEGSSLSTGKKRRCNWCGDHHNNHPAVRNASVYITVIVRAQRACAPIFRANPAHQPRLLGSIPPQNVTGT